MDAPAEVVNGVSECAIDTTAVGDAPAVETDKKHRRDTRTGKKLRRKKRSDSDRENGKTAADPCHAGLDSEGDSDINSEGVSSSSGSCSLAGSTADSCPDDDADSCSGSVTERRSSSAAEHDTAAVHGSSSAASEDQVDRVATLSTDSRYDPVSQTNGKGKSSGVSIENLKNSYLTSQSQSAKEKAAGDRKPRDLLRIAVNMESLKSMYSNGGELTPRSADAPAVLKSSASDLPSGLSLSSMRQAYEQQTMVQHTTAPASESSAGQMRSRVPVGELVVCASAPPAPGDLSRGRFRSEGDLTLASLPVRGDPGRSREVDVFLNVSVKTLRASFCDLTELQRRHTPLRQKVKLTVDICALRSSFNGQSQQGEQSRIHVRSFDSSKAIKKFSKGGDDVSGDCRACGRQVFQMERVMAESAVWHKNCFRCVECNRQLSVDTYASHSGQLYCPPHHKQLLQPKAVESTEDPVPRLRKHEVIVRESQPEELPADVVRSSSKSDYGLDELQKLNVKDRFSVFERSNSQQDEPENSTAGSAEVKRSQSIIKKMKRFQDAGGDAIGVEVSDASDVGSGDDQSEDESAVTDSDVIRSSKKNRKERPMSFSGMSDVKSRFEGGMSRREMMREERKGELNKLRDKICGARVHKAAYEEALKEQECAKTRKCLEDLSQIKQSELKASYQRALEDSATGSPNASTVSVTREVAATIASKFESGVFEQSHEDEEARRRREEDAGLFEEAGTAKGARTLFKQMDAHSPKENGLVRSPSSGRPTEFRQSVYESKPAGDVVKCSVKHDDVRVETSAISSRFKFFETYKEPEKQRRQFRFTPPPEGTVKSDSPEGDGELNADVMRVDESADEEGLMQKRTAQEMRNKFKQLELSNGSSDNSDLAREKPAGNAREVLSIFRQMEENALRNERPDGRKPLKSFTPPPEYTEETDSEEYTYTEDDDLASEYSDGPEDLENGSVEGKDEYLKKPTDMARNLTAKFERWEQKMERDNTFNVEEECKPSLDTAKNLKAMFESLKNQPEAVEKAHPKVSRFIMEPSSTGELCSACNQRVYAMERLEVDKRVLHKNCFRCKKCNCVLRMETYTFNAGMLYCSPHFKQMFKTKGDYDESFGMQSRTKQWGNHVIQTEADAAPPTPETPQSLPNGGHSDVLSPASDRTVDALSESVVADADMFEQLYESTVTAAE